jgi:integrase
MRPRTSRRQRRWRENRPVLHRGKWRVRWRDHAGQRRSEVYEREEDALLAVQRHQLEVEEIKRGLRPPLRAPDKTFADLFDYWLKKRAPRKRSGSDDESIIRAHLRPFFGPIPLRDFALAHVETFVEDRAHLSGKTIANLLTLLISTLNAAKNDLGWIATVPKIRKPAKFSLSDDYHYLRTKQEITRFLAAARDEGERVFALYATAIYTGMRAGEIAGLRWADVDFERRLITVQRSFEGPTKSGRIRHVPILNALLPILRQGLRPMGKLRSCRRVTDGNQSSYRSNNR